MDRVPGLEAASPAAARLAEPLRAPGAFAIDAAAGTLLGPEGAEPPHPAARTLLLAFARETRGAGATLLDLPLGGPGAPATPSACRLIDLNEERRAVVVVPIDGGARAKAQAELAYGAALTRSTEARAPEAGAPLVRILWQCDADGAVTHVGDRLRKLVGPEAGAIVGRRWRDLVGDLFLDPAGGLETALGRRETASNIELLWARDQGAGPLTVQWSGLPVFDATRRFRGFRGFLLAPDDPLPQSPADAAPTATAAPQAHDAAPAPAPAPEGDSSAAPAAEAVAPPPVRTADDAPQPLKDAPAAVEPPPPARAPQTAAPPLMPHLSSAERNAFREIARALGVRPADEPAKPAAPAKAAATQEPVVAKGESVASAATHVAAKAIEPPDAAIPVAQPSAEEAAYLEAAAAASSPAPDAQRDPGDEDAESAAAVTVRDAVATDDARAETSEAENADEGEPAAASDGAEKAPDVATQTADDQKSVADESTPEPSISLVDAHAMLAEPLDPPGEDAVGPVDAHEAGEPDVAAALASTTDATDGSAAAVSEEIPQVDEAAKLTEIPVASVADSLAADEAAATDAPLDADARGESGVDAMSDDVADDHAAPTPTESVVVPFAPPFAPPPLATPSSSPAEAEAAPPDPVLAHARDVLDRLPVGVLVNRGDRALFANRTLLDLLDYPSLAAIEAHGGATALFKGRAPMSDRDGPTGPVLLNARQGESVAVDARLQGIVWDGAPATLVTFRRAIDVEVSQKLKAAELDLRAREGELRETRAVLDTATDGVAVIDEDGRIMTLNRTAEALFGFDQNEVAGESISILFAPESHALAADYFEGLKSGGVRSVLNDGRELVGRARQGGRMPLFVTLGQISDKPSRKFCAVLRDLSSWKKTERDLVEARRAAEEASSQKSDFLAKISHEIRTPLNAIIGFAEVMMEERFGPVGNERYKDYLRDIHASGGHVISLVNDLLDLSKIEAGKLELSFTSVNANEIVRGAVSLMQPQSQRARVVVRSALTGKLPAIVADERALKQIVLNLLSNAVKFTDSGGQVIISTTLTDLGELAIRIRDTGIGMTEKELGEAMEPFRQLATSRRAGGTGLGLPLTKALVEANRAALKMSSVKGEGTLAEVVFPPTRVLAE